MPILSALGSGVFLFVLSVMMAPVLAEFEDALVAVLHGAKVSAETATTIITTAASTLPPSK